MTQLFKILYPYFDNLEPAIIFYSYEISSRNLFFYYTPVTSDVNFEDNTPLS